MIEFISKANKKNLILFVHGFTGSSETWLESTEEKRIPSYLLENQKISENFDLAYFEYYTKFTDKIDKANWLASFFLNKKTKFKKNLSIEDIKDILYSHIDIRFNDYINIIIIAHSMGGLISKATILKLVEDNKNTISLFISLAVPHNGSKLADIGKMLLKNPNINDLTPLSNIIDEVSRDWLSNNKKHLLPRTIYFQGKNDNIVPNVSSIGYDSRDIEKDYKVVYTDDDHSSILIPKNGDSTLLISIQNEILDVLKKKTNSKPVVSNVEIDNLLSKVGNKLNLSTPTFEKTLLSKDLLPMQSSHISNRKETIKTILAKWKTNWLSIYGMYDTGKTQLTLLISNYLNLNTIWISLKGISPNLFIQKILSTFDSEDIEELFLKIETLEKQKNTLIIFDDLFQFGSIDVIDNFFNRFIESCINNDILIISTSNYKTHNKILSIHNENLYEEEVRLLSNSETLEILNTYSDSKDFKYKTIIHDIAKGYPIYTQVICRYLESKNWRIQENELSDFITGNIFKDLSIQTLEKLVERVQDEKTRELLYRLNIVKTKITPVEINIVSNCKPIIKKPIEKINSIIGTWIQPINHDDFHLSPLINRLGSSNISETTKIEINYQLGKAILDRGKMSQIDVINVINYFISAKKIEEAGFILLNFLQYINLKSSYFFDWGFDLFWYHWSLPTQMPLFLRLFIRALHINIESDRDIVDKNHLNYLRNDLENLIEEAQKTNIDVYFPSIILSHSYLQEDSKKAMKYFAYYKNSYTYNNLPPEISNVYINQIEAEDLLIWLLLINISDIDTLQEWFDNYSKIANPINEDEEQIDIISEKLLVNFINKEEKKDTSNWEELLNIFEYIFEKCTQLNLEIFRAHTIKKQIKIISENLNNVERAENVFKKYIKIFKLEKLQYLLIDEIGRQFFYKNNNEKSLEYLDQIADIKLDKYNIIQIDTFTVLSKLYFESNKKFSLEFSKRALEFATENPYINELQYLNLIGEYSISLYLNNELENSLIELSIGYDKLLTTFEDDNQYKNVQLRYGNTISYIYQHLKNKILPDESNSTKPYKGFFETKNDISDLYFNEKLVIIIPMLVWFFEDIKDKQKAFYWANKAFILKKDINVEKFKMLYTGLIGYKIINDDYEHAIDEQIEIHQNLVLQSKENHFEELKRFTYKNSLSHDITYLVLTPICIRLLYKLLCKEITIEYFKIIFLDLLRKYQDQLDDPKLIELFTYIINNYPQNHSESQDLMSYINLIDKDKFGQIQFIGYIICSMKLENKTAFKATLLFKDTFSVFTGSVNLYILVPFFIKFWKNKIDENNFEFKNHRKLEENLNKVENLVNSLQIKAIFALVAESLNLKLNTDDNSWLKEYYDEYI